MNDSSDRSFDDLIHLLNIIERAVKKTQDPESLIRIDAFVGCLSFPVLTFEAFEVEADVSDSFLVSKAHDMYGIRNTALWKKTIDVEHYQEKIDEAMKELGQKTKHLFVRQLM